MYFANFPNTLFQVSPPSYKKSAEYVSMIDITKNVRFKKEILQNITLYDIYTIKDTEKIEHVSEKFYGSPHYHWVLMLLNDRYDYRRDLPLDAFSFNEYIIEKYGSLVAAEGQIKHYEDSRGFVVNSDFLNMQGQLDATPVYVYEYESRLNEEKRQIKILSEQLLTVVLQNFKELM